MSGPEIVRSRDLLVKSHIKASSKIFAIENEPLCLSSHDVTILLDIINVGAYTCIFAKIQPSTYSNRKKHKCPFRIATSGNTVEFFIQASRTLAFSFFLVRSCRALSLCYFFSVFF